jgi:hypothetical protein
MANIFASPSGGLQPVGGTEAVTLTLQRAIDKAQPGDTVRLLPGVYDTPVTIRGKQAGDAPITIVADTGATLDGRRSVLRPPNTINASDTAAKGVDIFAMIRVDESIGIILRNLVIQGAWPVALYLRQSSRIAVQGVNFNGSTIAILAWGGNTAELLVENCRWIQDERIYQGILWDDIHGGVKPRKELDGDFFRSFDIGGTCVFRSNYIANAFNGMQFFAREKAPAGSVNKNVWIYRNTFSLIRDNAIEAEYSAENWWVHENAIFNCHKWFAFEKCNGGHWYLFSNRGWFDRRQGPSGDCASGGAVFKASKVKKERDEDFYLPKHPVYVFHNSWYLRSAYVKDGKLRNFSHFNNAIEFADAARHPPGMVDPFRRMIGPGAVDPLCDDPFEPPETFTTEWARLGIVFRNDCCNHPTFPEGLKGAGYPVEGVQALPGFESGRGGDFAPKAGSAILGKSVAWTIELPDGNTWKLPAGRNIGAIEANPDPAAKAKFVAMTPERLGRPDSAAPGGFFTAAWLRNFVEKDSGPTA